jgi:hypothetical protein
VNTSKVLHFKYLKDKIIILNTIGKAVNFMDKIDIEKQIKEIHNEIEALKKSGFKDATAKQLAEYLVKVDELAALMLSAEKINAKKNK